MNSDLLYELGFQYKKTKLWKKLWESDLFAVKLDDGELAYVSIMGRGGDYCAIGIYVGDEGYRSYENIHYSQPHWEMTGFQMQEIVVSQHCYHLALDGKDDLQPWEVKEVRAYAKAHNIRLSGKNAYPHFLKLEPYCYPWPVMTEREQSYICQAVKATLRVDQMIRDAMPIGLGLSEEVIPCFELKDGQYELTCDVDVPKLKEVPFAGPKSLNEIGIRSLKKCKNRTTFECEIIILPNPIQEDPMEAPYLTHILLAVESENYFILPPLPMKNFDDNPEDMVNHFIQTLLDNGICPDQLLVRDERTFAMLKMFAKKLAIPIRIKENLEALDDAEDSFLGYMDEDMAEQQAMDELLDFIGMLLTLNKDDIKHLPPEILGQVKMLLDTGALPPDIARELKKQFDL